VIALRGLWTAPDTSQPVCERGGELAWADVLTLAEHHKVVPLLSKSLKFSRVQATPPWVLAELLHRCQVIAAHNMRLAREFVALMDLFRANDVRAIPFKGPTLALTLYGNIALRQFADLDVLVGERDYYVDARNLLRGAGWTLTADYGWECQFAAPSGKVFVDLHRAITHDSIPFRCSFNRLSNRSRPVRLFQSEFLALNETDLLFVLCLQAAKDVRGKVIQLNKICDIAAFVHRYPDIDWTVVIRQARRVGVLDIVLLGLRTVHDLLHVDLPPAIDPRLSDAPHLSSLVTHVRESILDDGKAVYTRPELLDPSRFHAEIRERWRDRGSARHFWSPNSGDYTIVRLPRSLDILYYVVRPLRLLHKHLALPLRKVVHIGACVWKLARFPSRLLKK
jgi:hypothetical protein